MELIGWCWMLLAFSLLFVIANMYILAIILLIASMVCFYLWTRNVNLRQEDIVAGMVNAVRVYKSV
jgi:hypothetical protein